MKMKDIYIFGIFGILLAVLFAATIYTIINIASESIYRKIEIVEENKMKVEIITVEGGLIPTYAHQGDAGADAYANNETFIFPGGTRLVPLGIKVSIPQGYEIQIRPKSGLAIRNGLTILNTPGTIDSGYTGEVKVLVYNTSKSLVRIQRHQKICQLVLKPVLRAEFTTVDRFEDTDRGDGGFGSTGLNKGD